MSNDFSSEFMGHKSITEIPGVCTETEKILKSHNIKEASEIYGRFLIVQQRQFKI